MLLWEAVREVFLEHREPGWTILSVSGCCAPGWSEAEGKTRVAAVVAAACCCGRPMPGARCIFSTAVGRRSVAEPTVHWQEGN